MSANDVWLVTWRPYGQVYGVYATETAARQAVEHLDGQGYDPSLLNIEPWTPEVEG